MAVSNRSLGLAALGWWLAARGLAEPIEESFTRLEPAGVQRLGKASRVAVLVATRRLARALREAGTVSTGPGGELFSIDPPTSPWIDRLEVLLNTPRIGLRLEKALTGDTEDFNLLLEIELAEDRAVMLAARLAGWLNEQLGNGDEPETLARFLAQGWPVVEGSSRSITFLEEFLANLQTELSDAPAEITIPLGEPSEFLAWLEQEVGSPAVRETFAPAPIIPESSAPAIAPPPALDLPPPSPPAPPAPPVEIPAPVAASSEPVAIPTSPPSEEPPISSPASPPLPPPPPMVPQPAPAEMGEGSAIDYRRQHRRLRFWAILLQVGWVVLLIAGWQTFQLRRSATLPATPATPATPAPASPAPAGPATAATPGVVQEAAPSEMPVLDPAPTRPSSLPLKPEMSVLPDEIAEQATSLAAAGHHAEAATLLRRMTQLQSIDPNAGRLSRALVLARLAASLAALERWYEADAAVERAQALLEELLPTHDAETALGIEMVADYWASRERWPLAARLYQKAVQTYENTPAENSQEQLSAVNRLAGALRQIGDATRAEGLYRQLVKAYSGAGSVVALEAASASHNLANLLLITNRAGEARDYYEQALGWLGKAPADDRDAQHMALLMRNNYERCLIATGLPEAEARQRAEATLRLAPAGSKSSTPSGPATPAPGAEEP